MDGGTDFGYGHGGLFLMNLDRSVRGGFLGFCVVAMVTAATAIMPVLFLA